VKKRRGSSAALPSRVNIVNVCISFHVSSGDDQKSPVILDSEKYCLVKRYHILPTQKPLDTSVP
jgi:hypothetical protein